MVTVSTRVKPGKDVLFRELGGEAVLLDVGTGHYFHLNEVGTRIWGMLVSGRDLAAIVDTLASEYDAPVERIRADTLAVVDELERRSLVTVENP